MGLAVEMVLAEKRGEVEGFSLLGLRYVVTVQILCSRC